MKCRTARKWINDYVDDALETRKGRKLERHIASCSGCQELLRDFRVIAKSAKKMSVLTPSNLTWEKIATGLKTTEWQAESADRGEKKGFPRLFSFQPKMRYAFGTLGVLALLIGGLLLWRPWMPTANGSMAYTIAKLNEAQHHYQLAIKALSEALDAQQGAIEPQLAAVFEDNLHIIDRSIENCRQAVQQEPGNMEARNYLLSAYREKMAVLDEYMEVKKSSQKRAAETAL